MFVHILSDISFHACLVFKAWKSATLQIWNCPTFAYADLEYCNFLFDTPALFSLLTYIRATMTNCELWARDGGHIHTL